MKLLGRVNGQPSLVEMNRFFVEKENIKGREIIIDNKEDLHHISKVLRLKEGDFLAVSNGIDKEYLCKIIDIVKEGVVSEILEEKDFLREPALRVSLFQGVPKQGKMEQIVQKCTELGVDSLIPVFTNRTVVTNKGDYWKKIVRYQNIAEEAAKQSQRGIIPEIRQATDIEDMIKRLRAYDTVIFAYEEEDRTTIKAILSSLPHKPERLALVIGPEGGFSPEEAQDIIKAGGLSVSLGKTILRTETAGPAALAMIMYQLEMDR